MLFYHSELPLYMINYLFLHSIISDLINIMLPKLYREKLRLNDIIIKLFLIIQKVCKKYSTITY